LIAKKSFPKATQVTDRFHVQKLALEAVQEVRIRLKWEALDQENQSILQAKLNNAPFVSKEFSNGDTAKQLLTRSRFLLYKSPNKWSENQKDRAT
ncbi:transposase, partial [Flavobacterium sp. PL002]|uniref:transposase n=1 Tax=Flavobacterium sp. PL002 TaxID=1897058 RepID=UPI001788827B